MWLQTIQFIHGESGQNAIGRSWFRVQWTVPLPRDLTDLKGSSSVIVAVSRWSGQQKLFFSPPERLLALEGLLLRPFATVSHDNCSLLSAPYAIGTFLTVTWESMSF